MPPERTGAPPERTDAPPERPFRPIGRVFGVPGACLSVPGVNALALGAGVKRPQGTGSGQKPSYEVAAAGFR